MNYIEIIENTYSNKIFEKWKDEETGSESIWINTEEIDEDVISNNIRLIDIYPKKMSSLSAYSYMESKLNKYDKIKNFINVILLLLSYSDKIIIDSNIQDNREILSEYLSAEIMEQINFEKEIFYIEEIEYNYELITELVTLALNEKIILNFYILDLKQIFEISGMYILVYNEDMNFENIEKISNVEGLYLRRY